MRRAALLVLLTAACARPVLYYPAPMMPEPTPVADVAARDSVVRDSVVPAPLDVANMSDAEYLRARNILVPVVGADMTRVYDSFSAPRDGDRVHRAIDILAPRGTPVVAADDGKILRMSTSNLGGITMYTIDPLGRLVYYYAHMDRYNDAMSPGRSIVRGDTLGYVGTTGNAPENTPHLHFQVMRWPSDGKYWNGDPINPFEALGGVRHTSRRNY